jgi:hypothetical protein
MAAWFMPINTSANMPDSKGSARNMIFSIRVARYVVAVTKP